MIIILAVLLIYSKWQTIFSRLFSYQLNSVSLPEHVPSVHLKLGFSPYKIMKQYGSI